MIAYSIRAKEWSKIRTDASEFTNPFHLEHEWTDYGIGDPFIVRFNGTYYLYCSTKDGRVGIKAWRSVNLIEWEYVGLVTTEEQTRTAYAPEVVYWNGSFYMYTSPAGDGHYVLRSNHPEGPFAIESGNLGMSIDGSVFIDDDGQWYFTHAGPEGIVGRKMTDPYTFGSPTVLEAYLGHWTEGSMIIKKNGTYYLTYTGNHVFSDGYRVHYRTGEHPLGPYKEAENNPLIIHTEKDFKGLGHSATVLGPDLDSYYITYHNLVGPSAEGPPVRHLNIDRLVFNGKKMGVLGPTNFTQPAPKMPHFFTWADESETHACERIMINGYHHLLFPSKTNNPFTAEFHMQLEADYGAAEQTKAGIVFAYVDKDNYVSLLVNAKKSSIHLIQVRDGIRKQLLTKQVPMRIDFQHLHCFRVIHRYQLHTPNKLSIFIDQLLLLETDIDDTRGGKIGYVYNGSRPYFGFTAFTNEANGSSDYHTHKPIPGTIEAIHSKQLWQTHLSLTHQHDSIPCPKKRPVYKTDDDTFAVHFSTACEALEYEINVQKDGQYGMDIVYEPGPSPASITFEINKNKLGAFQIPNSKSTTKQTWKKEQVAIVELKNGLQTLKISMNKGECRFKHIHVYPVHTAPIIFNHSLNNALASIPHTDTHGQWEHTSEGYRASLSEDAKLYLGERTWMNYKAILRFTLLDDQTTNSGGLLFRVSNESHHPHQVADSLMGYYLGVNSRQLCLYKVNYSRLKVAEIPISLKANERYELSVHVTANVINIRIFDTPYAMQYTDAHAFMTGKIGIRSRYMPMLFHHLHVSDPGISLHR